MNVQCSVSRPDLVNQTALPFMNFVWLSLPIRDVYLEIIMYLCRVLCEAAALKLNSSARFRLTAGKTQFERVALFYNSTICIKCSEKLNLQN